MPYRCEQAFLKPLPHNVALSPLRKLTYDRCAISWRVSVLHRLQHSDVVFRVADSGRGNRCLSKFLPHETQRQPFAGVFLNDVAVQPSADISQCREFRTLQECLEFINIQAERSATLIAVCTDRIFVPGINEHLVKVSNSLTALTQLFGTFSI